jgi:hypothetical protein
MIIEKIESVNKMKAPDGSEILPGAACNEQAPPGIIQLLPLPAGRLITYRLPATVRTRREISPPPAP